MTTDDKLKNMREQIKSLKKDPARKLSITDIKKEGYMPWAKHHRTIVGIIRADMSGPNLLKAKVDGEAKRLRYTVVAKNLINYLTTYGPMLTSLIRKPKNLNYGKGATKGKGNKNPR